MALGKGTVFRPPIHSRVASVALRPTMPGAVSPPPANWSWHVARIRAASPAPGAVTSMMLSTGVTVTGISTAWPSDRL